MRASKIESEEIFVQKQSFILDSIKQNRNRILFFLVLVLYALLTVLGTTDRDFFFENGIDFPLLNIKLPLIAFYLVVPIIIILVQFNVLYLYDKHQKLLEKHKKIKNFYSSMPLGIFDMPIIESGTLYRVIKIFIYLVAYIVPLLTLYILWWHFNKYQDSFYSSLHLFFLFADTLLLGFFLFQKARVGRVIAFALFLLLLAAIVVQVAVNNEKQLLLVVQKHLKNVDRYFVRKYYPHLELSGEQLVRFDYNQLKVLQSLEKKRALALLQPPLHLKNRSFKYADLATTYLIRANLSNTNLQGANLQKAQLQGANLRSAQLQGANLQQAQLQGADLLEAQLQGVYSQLYMEDFIKEMTQQIGKNTDLKGVEKKVLTQKKKKRIIAVLQKLYSNGGSWHVYIKDGIERIKKSTSAIPDLSEAKMGSYTKEEAKKWIEEYKKATGKNEK